jgi:membrane associated rhomboid family serine protease
MLIPIKHENMEARRWPVITIGLIVINVVVFLLTMTAMDDQAPLLSQVKTHILLLAALHPDLAMPPESQRVVEDFKQSHPEAWKQIENPSSELLNSLDGKIKTTDDPTKLQAEMDSLNTQLVKLSGASIVDQYAFVPAHPRAISYLTANFLHGGWLHLIGNMWFLWLAGFVLEDAWGRWLYSAFYLIAGAAAMQLYAWSNPGSMTATLGASGAVAALMGAFLVRFPKIKIEMAWLFMFKVYRFKAAAFWLVPLWLLNEVFFGMMKGSSDGVAHWAHVGGFLFGAVAALAIQHSGLEQKANKAIEEEISWHADPDLDQANALIEQGQFAEAQSLLAAHVAAKPQSLDAWNVLRQLHSRQSDTKAYLEATIKTCALHLKAGETEAAFQDYAEFINAGGAKMPAVTWLELCKGAEQMQDFERAVAEYQQLAATYPAERQALPAQLSAARLCLKRLNRPQEALTIYRTAAASPIPHLDWEQHIQTGIQEATDALSTGNAAAAAAR